MWFEHLGWPDAFQGLWRSALGVLGAFLAVLCLAGLFATSAWPRMHAGPGVMDGGRRLGGGGAAPLDSFTAPTGVYSFRRLLSSYSGPAIRIRRAADNAEVDIGFLGFTGFTGAPLDVAAAAAHCTSPCFGALWYDQSGNARHLTQTTTTSQQPLKFDCLGGLPCWETTTNQTFTLGGITPATGVVTLSAVGNRVSGGTGVCAFRQNSINNRIEPANGVLGQWSVNNVLFAAAAENAWHAVVGVINGASSVLRIDAAETTGSVTGILTLGATAVASGSLMVCRFGEFVVWDNYVLTPAERAAWTANQRSFWGF